MPTIIVPLKDIITDADHPIDLTTLPEQEAAQHIKDVYGFLSPVVSVTIHNGTATIDIPEEKAQQANQALRKLEEATRLAKRGRYNQAIPLFQEGLRILPEHTQARRDLAMALMETGSFAAAKKNLIRVMQLQPDDAWAYLILGNLYFQQEHDLGSAERYFGTAIDLAPDDPYILTSYAGVKAKRGNYAEACLLFERAIAHAPTYPNARYNLALCHSRAGDTEAALSTLEGLLLAPESDDQRHQSVYVEARKLYLELQSQVAEVRHPRNLELLRESMDAYTAQTGYAIKLEQDATLKTAAAAQLAWVHHRPHHVIKYKGNARAPLAHLLAHEFEHILLHTEAHTTGQEKNYVTTRATEQHARRVIDKEIRKLTRTGLDAQTFDTYIAQLISGLANQLYNAPLDLIIDSRVYAKYPYLHVSQFVSMSALQAEGFQALTDPNIRNMAPRTIHQANTAMNCAYALFIDNLFGGVTKYAEPYRTSGLLGTGQQLLAQWQQTMTNFQSGDEYSLVDAFAQILGLKQWYEWRTPSAQTTPIKSVLDVSSPQGGSTNPDSLQDPALQMAAMMYMVDALERFEPMQEREILQIAGEIALLGSTGLDYASSAQKYTLRFLPGESFSGLQLMAIMYVGFKKVKPELDTTLPLDDAYAQALSLYQSKQ